VWSVVGIYADKISFDHDAGSKLKYQKNLTSRGYRALIFSGDHDMFVPFTGSQAWTRSIGYKIVDEWRLWLSNGQVVGYTQGYDYNLTFLTIKGDGHTVPKYKPQEAKMMDLERIRHATTFLQWNKGNFYIFKPNHLCISLNGI